MLASTCLLLLICGRASEALKARTLTQAQCPSGYSAEQQDLTFFVLGDWGRGGTSNQRLVAALMALQSANCYKPSFIISTGDNFVSTCLPVCMCVCVCGVCARSLW
jgi:hypothetical protein